MFFLFSFFNRIGDTFRNRYIRRVCIALAIVLLCVILNSISFYFFERIEKQDLSIWDAFWLSFTTITTVGYGDLSATTIGGRIGTIVLLYLIGLATFPYVLTQIVDFTVERANQKRLGLVDFRNRIRDHIIIVNFPDELTIRAILTELETDPTTADRPIIIIDNSTDELPFEHNRLHFIRGSAMQRETLLRANIEGAFVVLVLSPNTDRKTADALTAAMVSIVEQTNDQMRVIAECYSVEHLSLFDSLRCSAVIPTQDIAAKILAQEIRDRGIAESVCEMLTQAKGSELYSHTISRLIEKRSMTFNELRSLVVEIRAEIVIVGVIRNNQPLTNPPPDLRIESGDRLLVISNDREDWDQIYPKMLSAIN